MLPFKENGSLLDASTAVETAETMVPRSGRAHTSTTVAGSLRSPLWPLGC